MKWIAILAVLWASMAGIVTADQSTLVPDAAAERAAAIMEKVKNFYDWADWADRAAAAAQAGREIPKSPSELFDFGPVEARFDELRKQVEQISIPREAPHNTPNLPDPERNIARLREIMDLEQKDLVEINNRRDMANRLNQALSAARSAVRSLSSSFLKMAPFFGESPNVATMLVGSATHMDTFLGSTGSSDSQVATNKVIAITREIDHRKTDYRVFDGLAKDYIHEYEREKQEREQRHTQNEHESHDAVGDYGSRHPSSGDSEPTWHGSIRPSASGSLLATIPNAALNGDPAVFEYPSPEFFLQRPPLEPPIKVPPGATINLMALFPSSEATVDIYARYGTGSFYDLPIRTMVGACGGAGIVAWTNSEPSVAIIHATAESGDQSDKAAITYQDGISRATNRVFSELAVMGWGYKPPPPGAQDFGSSPYDAVLTVVRADARDSIPGETGDSSETFSFLPNDLVSIGIDFPNESASVSLVGHAQDGTAFDAGGPFVGSSGVLFTDAWDNTEQRATITASGSVLDSSIVNRTLKWREIRINADLAVAGAGFDPALNPDANRPFRAVLAAAHVRCDGGRQTILQHEFSQTSVKMFQKRDPRFIAK